jgi:hypothetical protein
MAAPEPLFYKRPSPDIAHDGSCPIQARVLALEGRMDAMSDEVHSLSAEVRELAVDLRSSVKRSEALNVEMGSQLKRYADYTDRNLKQDERGAALEKRLTDLVVALRKMAGASRSKNTKGRSK